MQCPWCSTLNPAQARFCMSCGAQLVHGKVCTHCHALLPVETRYCFHCGVFQPQAADQAIAEQPQVRVGQITPVHPVHAPIPDAGSPVAPSSASITSITTGESPGDWEQVEAEPASAAVRRVQALPPARPLIDLLPELKRFIPSAMYEPLERKPQSSQVAAARDHLAALLKTTQTYLPRPVVDSPQPGGVSAGGMQQGVFLFGDVSGFTPLSEQLKKQGQRGAERIMEIINGLFTELVSELFDHGGDLLKFGGDALLGVFPASNEIEMRRAALRAAQVGLAMQRVLQQDKFAAIQAGDEIRTLKIKCGISAGPYFAAHIGTPQMMAFVTTGTTVNLAEQAEGHAEPGDVVLTQAAYDLAAGSIETGEVTKEPHPEFHRLLSAPLLDQSQRRASDIELPDGDPLAQITYLVERMSRLAAYLSPELISRIVTNPGDPRISPDHRPVTVMFANYMGVSELIEDLGETRPEIIVQHLNDYFIHMAQIVERFEGTLARMDQYAIGDRLVIFFGAPRAHEDDPIRAVATALEMQQSVHDHFAALPIASAVYRFRQRIGINTGHLFAGNAGAPGLRQEYTLMGDDINMAARLMSKAGWQEIFVSDKTRERVQELFDLEDKGELKVKGKEIRIHTYRVLNRRGEYRQLRGLGDQQAPLLGRAGELAILQKCFQSLLHGRGQILVLTGEGGLGKTRLTREARQVFETEIENLETRPRWIEGHALSFSEHVSYWLAADVFRHILELSPEDRPQDRLYRLWETCEELMGRDTAREVAPYLAGLLDIQVPDDWADISSLDPRVRQKQTLWAARQFISAVARKQPTVIVLDDLHWADEASLALFEDLLNVTDQWPVLFCLITRPVRQKGAWRLRDRAARDFHHRCTEIELRPLDQIETGQMFSSLLPGASLPEPVMQDVYDKSAGNPFYIEEIVRSMVDSGTVTPVESETDYLGDLVASLRRKNEPAKPRQWKADLDKIGSIRVPDTLHSALIARIDRLTEDARQALHMAAVIGRQFQTALLLNLGKASLESALPLAQLERDNLIQPLDASQEAYVFPDALVQEVAYENLLMQTRLEFHARIGRILEETLGERADLECELLAHHFANSNDSERAVHYLELAGRKAQSEFANQTALAHYTHLLALLPSGENDWRLRFAILNQRQKVYGLLGKQSERMEDLQAMLSLAESYSDDDRRGDALNALADLHAWTGQYDQAIQAAEQALEIKQATGDPAGQAGALHQLGVIAYYRGDYPRARQALEQAIALRHELQDLEGETWSEMYLCMMHFMSGDYGAAIAHNTRALEISESRQDWFQLGIHLTNAGRIALRLGEYDKALERLGASLEMKTRTGDRTGQGFSYYAIGLANYYLNHAPEAETQFQCSLDIRQSINDRRGAAQSQFGLGLAALTQGRADESLEHLQQAEAVHQELKLTAERIADRSWAARALLALARYDEARQASQQAMDWLAEQPNVEEVQQIYLNHYLVLQAQGDPGALFALKQAQQVVQTQAERIADAELRQAFLENVSVNREIAQVESGQ